MEKMEDLWRIDGIGMIVMEFKILVIYRKFYFSKWRILDNFVIVDIIRL